MTCTKQDKPYKSIDLTCTEMFAVIFALQDRERVLINDLALCRGSSSSEVVEECEGQLSALRAVLASLKTV